MSESVPARRGAGVRAGSLLRPALGAAILIALLVLVDTDALARLLVGASMPALALATALLFVENVVVALRWRGLLRPVGVRERTARLFRIYLAGHLISYVVPTFVSTDVYRAFSFRHRSRALEVASSIVVERVLGAASVLVAVAVGAGVVTGLGGRVETGVPLGLAAVVVLALVGVVAGLLWWSPRATALVPDRWAGAREGARRLFDSFARYRTCPGALAWAGALSLVIQGIRVASVYVLFAALGTDVALATCVLVVPAAYLSSLIPGIGSRVGTEQGVFIVLFGAFGVPAEAALATSLVNVALGALVAAPGAVELLKRGGPKDG